MPTIVLWPPLIRLAIRRALDSTRVGRLVSRTDPLGNVSSNVFDAANRPVASVDPLGNRTTVGFDAASRPVSSTNPLGFVRTNVFDAGNRLVASVDPLGNRSSMGYDAASRIGEFDQPVGLCEHELYLTLRANWWRQWIRWVTGAAWDMTRPVV